MPSEASFRKILLKGTQRKWQTFVLLLSFYPWILPQQRNIDLHGEGVVLKR